jgi:hypothetical protein
MRANDSFILPELFNTLKDVHDQPPLAKSELLELGAIFQKYNVTDKFMLGLLHKHYDLHHGMIAVTTEIAPNVTITKATAISSVVNRPLRGQLYFLHNDEWQAYEYEDGVPEEFDPDFLLELSEKVRRMGLEDRVSLGSSKTSLATREMLIANNATASFAAFSIGGSWDDLALKIQEVGWGFIASPGRPDMLGIGEYVGHGTSTSTGNHVVLYGNGCSYTTDFAIDLENTTDLLKEFRKHGWLKE